MRFDGGWRMYVSLATPNTKHWWIGVVTAPTLEALASAPVETAFAGDRDTAVKDPIVKLTDGVWHAWICCHLLDLPGQEDRMNSAYATSLDGLTWDWHGTVLEGRSGEWDSARRAPEHDPPRRPRRLRRPRQRGGELVRAHRDRAPRRRPLRLHR